MNNPVRAAIQKHVEARKLLRLGGAMKGGRALEIGCGRGVGAGLILDVFGADSVDAIDLDPRMVARAKRRLSTYGPRARVWVGDASAVSVSDSTYDAVFDFGIIHHILDWRAVLVEIRRVLRPGGRFYGEEALRDFVGHPISRRLLDHPQADRFTASGFAQELEAVDLEIVATEELGSVFGWFAARKSGQGQQGSERGLDLG